MAEDEEPRRLAPVQGLLDRLFRPAIPFEALTNVIKSNFRVDVLRPEDLIVMRLDFYNIEDGPHPH